MFPRLILCAAICSCSINHALATAAVHVSTDTITQTCWESEEQIDLCLEQCAPCIVACVTDTSSANSGSEYAFDYAGANCRETADTSGVGCAESQCSQCIIKMPCIMQDDDETSGGVVERRARGNKGKKSSSAPSASPTGAPKVNPGSSKKSKKNKTGNNKTSPKSPKAAKTGGLVLKQSVARSISPNVAAGVTAAVAIVMFMAFVVYKESRDSQELDMDTLITIHAPLLAVRLEDHLTLV